MKRSLAAFICLLTLLSAGVPLLAGASSGVSINTGKIVLDKPLAPGGTYDLPNVEVSNTGTDPSNYGISVQYNEVQDQRKPDAAWLEFTPSSFRLLPGESALVKVSIAVPENAAAGDYFAYIEADSLQGKGASASSISGAAAARLYFSVAQTNIFKSAAASALSLVTRHSPWSYVLLWILAIVLVGLLAMRIRTVLKSSRLPRT